MTVINPIFALSLLAALATPALSAAVRINALGDSITGSPGCWRALLYQKLEDAGVTNIDFVGTLPAQGCGIPYDGDNDGHGGFLATGIVSDNQLPGWLAISQPDIVMMELGTNDVWNNIATGTILDAFSTLVDQMRASKSTMRILVAQITPMNPSGCTTCEAGVEALNSAIPAWAAGKSTSASPITVVDCFTGYDTATDTGDGVHPNDSGNTKLANAWFPPLEAAILAEDSGSGSTPVTSTAPVTSTNAPATTTSSPPANTGTTGTAPLYGQCGGQGWTGATTCAVGTCQYSNDWYSQCLQ